MIDCIWKYTVEKSQTNATKCIIIYTVEKSQTNNISVFNLILPCILITGIALMSFYMPSDSGEKVMISILVMGIVIMMTMAMMMMASMMLMLMLMSPSDPGLHLLLFQTSSCEISYCTGHSLYWYWGQCLKLVVEKCLIVQVTLGITTLLSMTVFLMVIS